VSHEHVDHNNVSAVLGNPRLIDTVSTYEVKGIQFRGIAAYHDNAEGRKRGPNTIFRFEVDGIRLCHLGDLGHQLTDEQVAAIGEVDVLLIPVGGRFTIDATGASQVIEKLKPKVAIPMHYKTDKCLIPLARIDPFLEGKPNVKRLDASEVEFKKEELPSPTEIVVLKHAL
jgi:L-ascorbate metabolism protein UlaG (beta-lactamase superfamily)